MEQKQSKQRNSKSSTTKSESSTEKTLLKAESVVEVKSKNSKTTPAPQVAVQAQPTPTAKSSKAKKTETQPAPAPVPVQQAKSAAAAAPPPAPAVVAQQAKGKRVVQKAGSEKAAVAPAKTPRTTKKTETAPAQKTETAPAQKTETAPAPVQKAGAKATKKEGAKATKKVAEPVVKATKKVQKVQKEQKVNVEEAQEEKQMDDKLRYFKLYYNDNICGRYSGKKPKQAANKAFSSIIKDMRKTDNKEGVNVDITFTIKECTRNSFHKEYKYVGKRLLLKSPVKVTIENGDGTSKDIVYKYHNELKKAPKV
jgi:hypothetical protein